MKDSPKNDKGVILDFPQQIRDAAECDSPDFSELIEEYAHMWDDADEGYFNETQFPEEHNNILHMKEMNKSLQSIKEKTSGEHHDFVKINLRNIRFRDILSIPLPTPLEKRTMAQYAVAGLVTFICVLLSIYYKEISFLVGIIISGFLAYQAIATSIDFANGQICEIAVICTHVTESKLRNKTQITFRTDDEKPIFYQFDIPGKKSNEFQVNMVYVIYFNINNPRLLMTYTSA